ncbi:ketosynthase [Amycolatopsis ultiminotia]|uniref:ketosynthase n=1 Tax=Amycolatopsis ultiminotia TaxID=543629 RepID=UPI0031EC260E
MTALFDVPRVIAATACVTPWPQRDPDRPGAADPELPPIKGFVLSRFSPIVRRAVVGCLGEPGADLIGADGPATAIVLGTLSGDPTTLDTSTRRLIAGQVHSPLLFFQSVTTSILGHLGQEYGISGPVTCLSVRDDEGEETLRAADLLLTDESVRQVLVIGVEMAVNERLAAGYARAGGRDSPSRPADGDTAVAFLLRRAGAGVRVVAEGERTGPRDPVDRSFGWLEGLVGLHVAAERARSAPVSYGPPFPGGARLSLGRTAGA